MNRKCLSGNTGDHFGFELAYDKRTSQVNNNSGSVYANGLLNGNVNGMMWRSTGDGEIRKFDYSYDVDGPLAAADFNQYTNNQFDKSEKVDFSVSNLQYDNNGNIQSMKQMGLKGPESDVIDDLAYTYFSGGNQLKNVRDANNNTASTMSDFKTSLAKGALLEETHYYPFGLVMPGISDKAAKTCYFENNYKFNGGTELSHHELSDGSGLELYSTDFRSYDPQLGRFHQIDPLAGFTFESSPYAFANNNPLNFGDPTGLSADTAVPGVPLMPAVTVIGYRGQKTEEVAPEEEDTEPDADPAPAPAAPATTPALAKPAPTVKPAPAAKPASTAKPAAAPASKNEGDIALFTAFTLCKALSGLTSRICRAMNAFVNPRFDFIIAEILSGRF